MHLGAENRCSSLIRSGWFLADGSVLVLSCAAPAEVCRQILRVVGVPLQRPRPLCGGRTTSAASRLLPVQKKTETGAGTKKDLLLRLRILAASSDPFLAIKVHLAPDRLTLTSDACMSSVMQHRGRTRASWAKFWGRQRPRCKNTMMLMHLFPAYHLFATCVAPETHTSMLQLWAGG